MLASTQLKLVSSTWDRWSVVVIGAVVIVLGTAALIGGLTNLAIAPAMAAARRQIAEFPVPLGALHSPLAIAVWITQHWPSWVAAQLVFATITLTAGVAFLRRRPWARIAVEGLGWVGVSLFAIPIVWVARWVLATPTDRLQGFGAGLQTLPSGVGQPVATVLLLFFGGPGEWGRLLLARMGVVDPTPAIDRIFVWTPMGSILATCASLGIPVIAMGLVVLLRRRPIRQAFDKRAREADTSQRFA
jgi:hypothetical protein